jgi:predicted YcjX-like family ATPase
LLDQSYEQFSQETLDLAQKPARQAISQIFLSALEETKILAKADEAVAKQLSGLFKSYLLECRKDTHALSMLPPGRFLMPGDLEDSPALTFAPLPKPEAKPASDSLYELMQRRFEAYKRVVVKPFFVDHFARLDRQVVMVDALQALNAGSEAIQDLEHALTSILKCFRPGSGSWLSGLLGNRLDRILFAATKADHLHQSDHDKLERFLDRLVHEAQERVKVAGAEIETLAIAAVRATREAKITENGVRLPAIAGTPIEGETIDGDIFDGIRDVAVFPGDFPDKENSPEDQEALSPVRFVRFRPPKLERKQDGSFYLPHIRLDRALDFIIGDKLA